MAQHRPQSVISEPYERDPNAITRPVTPGDREWRRGRKTPSLQAAPQQQVVKPYQPPRYDRFGQRRNIPGRPDTLDAYGRTHYWDQRRPSVNIQPSGPTVRTDAATRINQLAPR